MLNKIIHFISIIQGQIHIFIKSLLFDYLSVILLKNFNNLNTMIFPSILASTLS